jgi:hypothetical protein
MDLPAIKEMKVGEIALPDCALFLWCIWSMLPEALEVVAAWGRTSLPRGNDRAVLYIAALARLAYWQIQRPAVVERRPHLEGQSAAL